MKNFFKSKKKVAGVVAAVTIVVAVFNPKVAGIIKLVTNPLMDIFYGDQTEQVVEPEAAE